MPSILLGNGLSSLNISGDVLRVDSMANCIDESSREQEQIIPIDYFDTPADDIKVCDLPRAVRKIYRQLASSLTIRVKQELYPFNFYTYSEEVEAWLLAKEDSRPPFGYSIDSHSLAFFGLIPLGKRVEVGKSISDKNPSAGIVIAPTVGLLTPWNWDK